MNLKERLANGERLIGAGIYSDSPSLLEYTAAGMDWIWWEMQHTHGNWQTLAHAMCVANRMAIPALVRTWTHDVGTIERLLDTGADGLIAPLVDTAEQAEAIVAHCYFPPAGERSFGSLRIELLEEDLDIWNRRIATVMMIETPEAVKNAEAIAAVPGVDALLVGARDLALRRGTPGDEYTAHAKIEADLAAVVQACNNTGKAAATVALTPEAMAQRIDEGYRLIMAGFDTDHVRASYQRMQDEFRRLGSKIRGTRQ